MDSDILIIGAGIFGVSTAYHLAQRLSPSPSPSQSQSKPKVTILDRAPPPSTLAASTDINKIVRADYSSPFYMDIAYEAMDAWANMPLFKDASVYHQTGWVMMDEEGSDLAARIRRNFRESHRPDVSVDLTLDEVRTRWGGLLREADFGGYDSFYANASAGWVDAAQAVELMATEAIKLGVEYEIGEVQRIITRKEGDDGIVVGVEGVETKDGRIYTARKVLLATGAWTSLLMTSLEDELGLAEDDRVEQQITAAGVCVAHFRLSDEEAKLYGQLPVLIYGAKGEVLPPTKDNIFKFTNALSFKNTIVTSTEHKISVPPCDQANIPPKLLEECIRSIRQRLPQILHDKDGKDDRPVDSFRLCWDSISPDQNPVITKHPDSRLPNLYLAVGGSFHCWKFLPIIGKYVVNVLEGISNGGEKDRAWMWKATISLEKKRGVHEKVIPRRELRDLE